MILHVFPSRPAAKNAFLAAIENCKSASKHWRARYVSYIIEQEDEVQRRYVSIETAQDVEELRGLPITGIEGGDRIADKYYQNLLTLVRS